jgi:hypothetical protein
MADYSAEKSRRFKEAFFKAARDHVKLASEISARPAEDLREEERTVVYRKLISQLMSVGTTESKHVISELVRSIFDVDKMLYFVAPEWWMPRLHRSAQHLGEVPPSGKPAVSMGSSVVGGAPFSSIIARNIATLVGATIGSTAPEKTVVFRQYRGLGRWPRKGTGQLLYYGSVSTRETG